MMRGIQCVMSRVGFSLIKTYYSFQMMSLILLVRSKSTIQYEQYKELASISQNIHETYDYDEKKDSGRI